VWGIDKAHQMALQLNNRRQVNLRRANRHRGANHGIEHPTGDRYDDPARSLHLQKLACCSLFDTTYQNSLAEIRVVPVMNFQLLPDMGRMNG
jgi:hypothetical protein